MWPRFKNLDCKGLGVIKKSIENRNIIHYAMDSLISVLRRFSEHVLGMGSSIDDDRIEEFEQYRQIVLPNDFKQFIKRVNGFELMGTEVYGFDNGEVNAIENVYYFEHFEVIIPQYDYLVPFSPDGRGNFYCLDTAHRAENGDCSVVFWVSNYEYSHENSPEITHHNFLEWVQEVVIDWTLEDYNYDGSEK